MTRRASGVRIGMVCGLWQAMQSRLHPWKNAVKRLPGPSTQENGTMSAISAVRPVVLDDGEVGGHEVGHDEVSRRSEEPTHC